MAEEQNVRASLGCGTLILIAIIVLVFGGHNDHERLEKKIDDLHEELKDLRRELNPALQASLEESSAGD
jgi:Sec-independent protein translocase protein TatA